jgi:hypothetical protein
MEDLLNNDTSFELFTNSSDAEILNRTLMSYPSEKSSFQVFLGSDGYSNFEPKNDKEKEDEKKKFDAEKLVNTVTQVGGAVGSLQATIDAFKPTDERSIKIRELCGKKPVFGKDKKRIYNECVAKVNESLVQASNSSSSNKSGGKNTETTTVFTTKNIVIGLVVVGVITTAIIGFKKGWFK